MRVTMQCENCKSRYPLIDRMTPDELREHAPDCSDEIYRASIAAHQVVPDTSYTADLIRAAADSTYMRSLCRRLIDERWTSTPEKRSEVAAAIAGELIRAATTVVREQGLAR
ncbi:hypothetical protein C41B8_05593 [Salinisphaera hydrothermalis C41B8]|uniref:Uncharacterized protein n=2 Tax=Salinisphaera TaxID=180541 RepID=A0A084INR6_SALHC|nr:hypothetical protein C41B8_05593 [Salinisphaera hydrothermalis C41B8]